MKRLFLGLILVGMAGNALAAEYTLTLNDSERSALLQLIDEATKAKGLAVAPNAVFLANRINTAPEKKPEPVPAEPK